MRDFSPTLLPTLAVLLNAIRRGIPPTNLKTSLSLWRTLAWDWGIEMARWRDFAEATGFEAYFCGPRSSWRRGAGSAAD